MAFERDTNSISRRVMSTPHKTNPHAEWYYKDLLGYLVEKLMHRLNLVLNILQWWLVLTYLMTFYQGNHETSRLL